MGRRRNRRVKASGPDAPPAMALDASCLLPRPPRCGRPCRNRAVNSAGAVRAVFLRLYVKERRGHDARNRGFGLASCSRSLVFLRWTLQAHRAEDWCSQRRTLQTQMPNEATDGLAPSVLDSSSGAGRAAFYEFPPASEDDSRRETPGIHNLQRGCITRCCCCSSPRSIAHAQDGSTYVLKPIR